MVACDNCTARVDSLTTYWVAAFRLCGPCSTKCARYRAHLPETTPLTWILIGKNAWHCTACGHSQRANNYHCHDCGDINPQLARAVATGDCTCGHDALGESERTGMHDAWCDKGEKR